MRKNIEKKIKPLDKKFFFVSIFFLILILISQYYPINKDDTFQNISLAIVFMLVIPILFIKIVLKEKLESYGFKLITKKKVIFNIILFLMIVLVLFLALFKYILIKQNYNLPLIFHQYFLSFFLLEFLVMSLVLLLIEVFFRGVIQFFLEQYFSSIKAILLQSILFFLLLYFSGSKNEILEWPFLQLILIAPLAGWIAKESKSWFYSWLFSWLFMILSDAIIIYFK